MKKDETSDEVLSLKLGPYALTNLRSRKLARAYVDISRRPAYVLIDGSKMFADFMIELLRADGIEPLRHGSCRRVADDGHFYDWWIRIPHDERAVHLKQELAAAESDSPPASMPQSHMHDSQTSVPCPEPAGDRLSEDWVTLMLDSNWPDEATAAQAAPATSESEQEIMARLDRLKQSHEGIHSSLQKQLADVQEAVQRLSELLSEPPDDTPSFSQTAELLGRVTDLEADLNLAKNQLSKSEADYSELFQIYEEKSLDADTLRQSVKDLQRQNEKMARALDKGCTHGMDFITAMFPSVSFERDSLEVIWEQLESPAGLARRLREITDNSAAGFGESVHAAPGYRELHFSTGSDDDGRVYFRRDGSKAVSVLVSFKAHQQRDIAWLKSRS